MNRLCLLAFFWAIALPVFSKTTFFQTDTVPPVVVCPPSDTVVIAQGPCTSPYTFDVIVSDDQPGVVLTQTSGLPSGADFPLGVTVNRFLATDAAGNTSKCSFRVSITRPFYSLECEEYVEVHLDPLSCSYTIEPDLLLDPGYLVCPSIFSLYIALSGPPHPNAFDASDIGSTFYVATTDTVTMSLPACVTQVKILGAEPTISCSDLEMPCVVPYEQRNPDFLRDSLGLADGYATVFDACGDVLNLTHLDAYLPGGCTGSIYDKIRRTWKVTDAEGYSATCIQEIRFTKVTLPEIQIPDDEVLNLNCNTAWDSSLWHSAAYMVYQNRVYNITQTSCHVSAVSYDTVIGLCEGSRDVLRTFALIDWCAGEFQQGTQLLHLPDPDGPVFSCDSVIVLQTDAPDCTVEWVLPQYTVSDYCSYATGFSAKWFNGTDTIVHHATFTIGADTIAQFSNVPDFPAGHTIVTFEATDACGVVSTCQTQVQVWDNEPPTLVCDSIATVYLPFEQTLVVLPSELPIVANDACAQLFYKIRRIGTLECDTSEVWTDAVTSCCAESGDTLMVQIRAYDVPTPWGITDDLFGAGQWDSCTMRLVVADTVTLRCVAPQDTVVSCFDLQNDLNVYGDAAYPCTVKSLLQTDDFQDFDSLCRRGVILRKFRVFDAGGQSATCEQNIQVVGPDRNFAVRFPNDVISYNCATAENPAISGMPLVLNNACSLLEITYQDVVFTVAPDACLKLERTWTILDLCLLDSTNQPVVVPNPMPSPNVNAPANLPGPTVSAPGSPSPWTSTLVKISPIDPDSTDYSIFWNDTVAGFTYKQIIKIIDNVDPTLVGCTAGPVVHKDSTGNDQFLWNDPLLAMVPSQGNRPEMPVALSITGFESCPLQDITSRSWLFLDIDNNGSQETVVFSPLAQTPGQVRYNNFNTPGFVGGTPLVFDKRPVPDSLKYKFVYVLEVIDSQTHTKFGRWMWQSGTDLFVPEFPQGNHKVKWEIEDGCGNEAICNHEFTVEDGLAPVLECLDTVSILMQPNGTTFLNATDALLTSPSDNYTPDSLLLLSITKNTSPNFPLDPSGDPVGEIAYNCFDPGFQTAQLWVQDANNNAASCTFIVEIVDPAAYCNLDPIILGGRLYTYGNRNITNTIVTVEAGFPLGNFNAVSNMDGRYEAYYASSGVNFNLKPQRYHDPANGISTFDLVLINSHILNIQPFDSPYKTIAADANNSKTVTTADIGVLRRLILGLSDTLPGQRAWVFVDSAYVFPNPDNPFSPQFPQSKLLINPAGTQLWHHFVGIKIGDVNDNAIVDSLFQIPVDDRKPLVFELDDRQVAPGDIIDLLLVPQADVVASQFTLHFPGFEVLEMNPNAPLSGENAALFAEKNKLTFSNDAGGKTGLHLRLRALENSVLSEKLKLSGDITSAEAWSATGEKLAPQLVFRNAKPGPELEVQPSVFSDQTVLYYHLPSVTKAELFVYNAAGQLLLQQTVPGSAGEHQFVLTSGMVGHAVGSLSVQLRVGEQVLNGKVIRQ